MNGINAIRDYIGGDISEETVMDMIFHKNPIRNTPRQRSKTQLWFDTLSALDYSFPGIQRAYGSFDYIRSI